MAGSPTTASSAPIGATRDAPSATIGPGPHPGPPSGAQRPRSRRFRIALVVATAVVIVVAAGIYFGPLARVRLGPVTTAEHTVCASSGILANASLWTPLYILNSPYHGNASALAVVRSSPNWTSKVGTGFGNGTTSGQFTFDNWTLTREHAVETAGPGADLVCPSGYVATDTQRQGANVTSPIMNDFNIPKPSNLSDEGLADQIDCALQPVGTCHPGYNRSVDFDAAYANQTLGTYIIETGESTEFTLHIDRIAVVVPFSLNGTTIDVPAVLPVNVTAWYTITDGTFQIDDLSATTGGGLAFVYTPLPD